MEIGYYKVNMVKQDPNQVMKREDTFDSELEKIVQSTELTPVEKLDAIRRLSERMDVSRLDADQLPIKIAR